VVLAINARVADGRDPSWLWDVAYQRLAGRVVLAAGERCLDLSVRLRYAGVEHQTVPDVPAAVVAAAAAAWGAGGPAPEAPGTPAGCRVDLICNYTAFHDIWQQAHR